MTDTRNFQYRPEKANSEYNYRQPLWFWFPAAVAVPYLLGLLVQELNPDKDMLVSLAGSIQPLAALFFVPVAFAITFYRRDSNFDSLGRAAGPYLIVGLLIAPLAVYLTEMLVLETEDAAIVGSLVFGFPFYLAYAVVCVCIFILILFKRNRF